MADQGQKHSPPLKLTKRYERKHSSTTARSRLYYYYPGPTVNNTNVNFISAEIGKVSLMNNLFRHIFQVGTVLASRQK